MSLNNTERQQTIKELNALRQLLPVSDEQLANRLGYGTQHLNQVMNIDGVDPTEVWQLRDFMVAIAQSKNIEFSGFSKLEDRMRPMAQMWFGTWTVPDTAGL